MLILPMLPMWLRVSLAFREMVESCTIGSFASAPPCPQWRCHQRAAAQHAQSSMAAAATATATPTLDAYAAAARHNHTSRVDANTPAPSPIATPRMKPANGGRLAGGNNINTNCNATNCINNTNIGGDSCINRTNAAAHRAHL